MHDRSWQVMTGDDRFQLMYQVDHWNDWYTVCEQHERAAGRVGACCTVSCAPCMYFKHQNYHPPNTQWAMLKMIAFFFRAVLGNKLSLNFFGKWDFDSRSRAKYRSRRSIETVPEEILISHSHPNRSRGNPDFSRKVRKSAFPVYWGPLLIRVQQKSPSKSVRP